MKKQILAILIGCFFASSVTSYGQKFQDSIYTASELKADLVVLKEALTTIHPSLYAYQTPIELAEKFAKVDAALKDGMTDLDFLGLVSTITKSIGCGHTATYPINNKAERKRLKKLPVEKRDTFNYLPFSGRFIAHRLFVGESFDSLLAPTTEILSIDNHSIAELEQTIYNFPPISEDGQGERLTQFFAREGALKGVYSTYFSVKDSVAIVLQGPAGKISRKFKTKKIHEFTREPVVLDSIQWNLKFRAGKVKKKYRRMHSSIYFYQHINRPEVALLNIKTFKSGFKPTFNLVFDYLKSKNTKHLIIDLRGNLGGDIESVISLLSQTLSKPHTFTMSKRTIPDKVKKTKQKEFFLLPFFRTALIHTKYKKKQIDGLTVHTRTIKPITGNHFDGKIYVLIDGGSFSGSSILGALLQNDKRALFFGEETGGAEQLTNGALYFLPKAPNTRITIRIPRYKINHRITGGIKGRGVRPDYPVTETIESFINGKDLSLEKVLSVIAAAN